MEISIVYQDGMMDMVSPLKLQKLINHDGIIKFQRSDGWVYPEIDPVRNLSDSSYRGPERRLGS
ncbi:MAG: hypothetical protein KAU22_10045 [Desulfuromonadales bacterium]|nr:hypothetical protein [Desulfuromonadales bacterium]